MPQSIVSPFSPAIAAMPIRAFTLLIAVLALGAHVPSASAQFVTNPSEVIAQGISYKVFARPGEPLIRVHVLGELGSGLYAIGANTTLTELLALAGGPQLSGVTTETTREVTVRVFRDQGAQRQQIYESDIRDLIVTPGQHPTLEEGDVVTVESVTRRRFDAFRAIQVASSIATFGLLILRVADRI
jgi:hypothetical protein